MWRVSVEKDSSECDMRVQVVYEGHKSVSTQGFLQDFIGWVFATANLITHTASPHGVTTLHNHTRQPHTQHHVAQTHPTTIHCATTLCNNTLMWHRPQAACLQMPPAAHTATTHAATTCTAPHPARHTVQQHTVQQHTATTHCNNTLQHHTDVAQTTGWVFVTAAYLLRAPVHWLSTFTARTMTSHLYIRHIYVCVYI